MAIDAIECFTCFHPAWRAELRRGLLEFRQLVLRQHAWKAAQSQGHGARWCEHVRVESSLRPLHKWLRIAAWHSQLTDTDWMVDVCWGGSVSWSQASLLLQGLPMFILHGFPFIYTSNLFAMSIHFFHHLPSSSIIFHPFSPHLPVPPQPATMAGAPKPIELSRRSSASQAACACPTHAVLICMC